MAETAFPREIMAHLDDLDNMSTTQVDQVVSRTIGILCRSSPATDDAAIIGALAKGIPDGSPKALYASLCSVLVEAARQDFTEDIVASALVDAGVGSETAQQVGKSFLAGKARLRWMLECTGIGQLTLVDFTWRLDYHVRSSATGIEHVPVYFVSMKTKAPNGEYGQKDFTLSHEQMQDMLATVRDAIKAVEADTPALKVRKHRTILRQECARVHRRPRPPSVHSLAH